jgi:hypothetical protein
MGVPTSEVGYTSATTGRGDHEVHKGHVVAVGRKKYCRTAENWMSCFERFINISSIREE